MGWSRGYDIQWNRDVGYGVPAICDHPDCSEEIDRGLGYVCGADIYGGEHGCGLFFCSEHQEGEYQNCERCDSNEFPFSDPFEPSADVQEWIQWKKENDKEPS